MAFPRRLLVEGEELVLDLRPHWIALVGPALVAVLVLGGWAFLLPRMPEGGTGSALTWLVLAAGAAVLLLYPVRRLVRWATSHFVVTSDRVIHREGLIARASMEIPLEAINDVRFRQGVFERIIGAGDLIIESAGEHGQSTFEDIRRPEAVQLEIYRQMEANQQRMVGGPGPRAPSALDDLERLAALRDRGVITEAEFQRKKQELLGRM